MRERLLILLAIMLATAFLGEMKMNPLGDTFRFSLGIAAFFFGMLWFQSVPILLTGFLVGLSTVCFRVGLDVVAYHVDGWASLSHHLPAFVYYVSFSVIIYVTRLRDALERPLWVGFIGTAADFASNVVELSVRQLTGETYPLNWQTWLILLLFGSLRSFFVVGVYNSLSIRHVRSVALARQQELDRLLTIFSNLYEEGLYLQKSMRDLEEITRQSYQLYKRLKQRETIHPSLALKIAKHVHEVKKDSQRIFAGISKMIDQKSLASDLGLCQLCELVIRVNQKYAEMIGKCATFTCECHVDASIQQVYGLLSVLNNLVANAVEAIPATGRIRLGVRHDREAIVFDVIDSGPGIPREDLPLIFQPGYTTKYDQTGNPSTGIGLTHARDIVQSLGGTLSLTQSDAGTQFTVRLPTESLFGKDV